MRSTFLISYFLLCISVHAQQWNWAASAGGGGNVDFCWGIATDSQGNAYWAGSVSGSVDFGCVGLSTGSSDIMGFLAKRAPDGTCVWVRGITTTLFEAWTYDVAIDADDRIYITGSFQGNADFGNGITLSGFSGDDIFLARYDTAGTCMWARRAGSSSDDEAHSVDVSAEGDVFLTGTCNGTSFNFDGTIISNPTNYKQLVVARYDSLGTVQWVKASTGNGQGKSARAISVAGDRLFVTGQVGFSAATFDGTAITPGAQGSYLYVLATDLDGNAQWARSYGTGDNEGMGISADTLGNVFVAGRLWGNLHLPDDTLTSVSSNDDMLMMKLDRDGDLQWARSTGSLQRDLAWDVAADGMGNAYFSAQFNNTIDYFGTSVTALGGEDILISKLDGDGDVVWVARPSGYQRDIPLCIHRQASAPHEIYFGGYFWGAITYGSTTIDDVQNGDAMIVAGVDTTFDVSSYAEAICQGDCNGVAHVFANGVEPLTYLWNTGATTPALDGLCAGAYTVEVTDGGGNSEVHAVEIVEHEPMVINIQTDGDSLWVEGGSDWTWELDGFQVGAGQPYHIASASGTYVVHYIDGHGCLSASPEVNVVLNVGLPETDESAMHVWPVPARSLLFIEHAAATTQARLLDLNGQVVRAFQLNAGRNRIDLSGLASGFYLLRSADGGVARVMVQ
ncbi:MAG: T9SS type A sorting domain-containing protein [Flavobacteriales bacterium]